MYATIDPGMALAFAIAILSMAWLFWLPFAIADWRKGQTIWAHRRERKLVELHIYAESLRQQIAARRALDEAA